MTADIVNLRQRRKRLARADREAEAAANRAKFGEPKTERRLREMSIALTNTALEAHKRDKREE